jgi:putative NADPH-quinone reductase
MSERQFDPSSNDKRSDNAMNILVILGHPDPKSFNHAIARVVCDALEKKGHTVIFHDLYRERFDPLLPAEEIPETGPLPMAIQQHCEEISEAEGIVIVHPNWWGQPPAILKGWIDRVIRPGVAYRFEEEDSGEGVPIGLLKARQALVLNTSNTPTQREQKIFGDPLDMLWKMCIFDLCGVRKVHRRMFNVICTSNAGQREQWLSEAADLASELFPNRWHASV